MNKKLDIPPLKYTCFNPQLVYGGGLSEKKKVFSLFCILHRNIPYCKIQTLLLFSFVEFVWQATSLSKLKWKRFYVFVLNFKQYNLANSNSWTITVINLKKEFDSELSIMIEQI